MLKYNRKSTRVHLKSIGSSLPAGRWNNDETVLVIVLMKLCQQLDVSDGWLPKMYNNYHVYNLTIENRLDIRDKSRASVEAKVKDIRLKENVG